MTSRLQRAVSRLLDSSPNYVEITALLATALVARLLSLPVFWRVSPQACVAVALFVSIFVYACVDRASSLPTSVGFTRVDASSGSMRSSRALRPRLL